MTREMAEALPEGAPLARGSGRQQGLILAVSLLVFSLGYLPFHAFSAFLLPATMELGAARGELAAIISLYWIVRAVTSPLVGFATNSLGPLQVQLLGTGVLGLTLLLAARAQSLAALYLAYGLGFGLAASAITDVPIFALLQRYFSRWLGTAMGIAAVGMSAGMVVMPWITGSVAGRGWRATVLSLAVVLPVLLGLVLLAAMGLGRKSGNRQGPSAPLWPLDPVIVRTVRSPAFRLLFGAVVLGPFAFHTPLVHQVAYLDDLGYQPALAASAITLMGFASVIGRLVAGGLSDRIGRATTYRMCAVLAAAALLALPAGRGGSPAVVLWYGAAFGLGYGAFAPLFPAASADLFAGRHYPTIHALLFVGLSLGAAVGSWVPGILFDNLQSYRPALVLAALALLVSGWLYGLAQSQRAVFVGTPEMAGGDW